jgi:hypothetical protein
MREGNQSADAFEDFRYHPVGVVRVVFCNKPGIGNNSARLSFLICGWLDAAG